MFESTLSDLWRQTVQLNAYLRLDELGGDVQCASNNSYGERIVWPFFLRVRSKKGHVWCTMHVLGYKNKILHLACIHRRFVDSVWPSEVNDPAGPVDACSQPTFMQTPLIDIWRDWSIMCTYCLTSSFNRGLKSVLDIWALWIHQSWWIVITLGWPEWGSSAVPLVPRIFQHRSFIVAISYPIHNAITHWFSLWFGRPLTSSLWNAVRQGYNYNSFAFDFAIYRTIFFSLSSN